MKLKYFCTLILAAASLAASAQDDVIYYGYAPRNPSPDEIVSHGTGMNNFIEAGICLNPANDPVIARLKGSEVLGVRCFLRTDYKQKSKRWSGVWVREGSLENTAAFVYENLTEGWNEVRFATPVTIDDSPIYLGYQVFEQKGVPYPVVSYSQASVNDGFYINMKQEGFNELKGRGTLLIEAIIKPAVADFSAGAFVQASGYPKAVAPGSTFDCVLYIRSQMDDTINSLEVTTTSDEGATVHKYEVTLDTPMSGFDGTVIPYALEAPLTEGESVPMQLAVTAINGKPCADGKLNSVNLYVSEDAFERVPVIEEFTGLSCVNCPFMAYYLDKALEKYGPDHIYVSHHAGFQDDKLTMSEDKALLYLFGGDNTYNPAVMYDRRVLSGNAVPVISAKEAASEPYTQCLEEAMAYPAKANVMLDVTTEGNNVACRVHGKVAKAMLNVAQNIHLSVYLVEDGIKSEGDYRQNGVSANVAEDAPGDMVERFRHNGLIRIAFTGQLGDKIEVDEKGYFDVTFTKGYIRPMGTAVDSYQDAVLLSDWVKDNMRAVAIVHKANTDVLAIEDNFVLNGGQTKLVGEGSSIDAVSGDSQPDGIYSISGQRVTNPGRGLYIINGNKAIIK